MGFVYLGGYMKFFKPEDFPQDIDHIRALEIANAKLEREGKICYSNDLGDDFWVQESGDKWKYKALIINIEPLLPCSHPEYKVNSFIDMTGPEPFYGFQCECGAKLKPKTFEEVE